MDYGLQLYSVRDYCDVAMDYCFSRLNEFKYKFVEFAGFSNYSAEEVKEMLDRWDLSVIGAHVDARLLKEDFDGVIKFHKTIGNTNIVIPSYELYTKELVEEFIAFIHEYQPKIEAEGMKLHFHNHHKEFKPNRDGVVALDEIISRTNILLEVDTFWAHYAGLDPVEFVKKYKDRIELLHIKDGLCDEAGTGKSLGEGSAPVEACVRMALEMGLPIIVESEGLIPDGISESKRCYKYLRKMGEEMEAANG